MVNGVVVHLSLTHCRCLEAIIQEQLEKLTATIRDIRTLDIYVRTTTSKLSKLIDQFEVSLHNSVEVNVTTLI